MTDPSTNGVDGLLPMTRIETLEDNFVHRIRAMCIAHTIIEYAFHENTAVDFRYAAAGGSIAYIGGYREEKVPLILCPMLSTITIGRGPKYRDFRPDTEHLACEGTCDEDIWKENFDNRCRLHLFELSRGRC
jgi:hypothetical protein